MHFSVKVEYGVMALMELALAPGPRPLQVKVIARREGKRIPVRFLEQVMSSLKKAGFVASLRGAQGGYMLARLPSEIRLGEVISAIDGPIHTALNLPGEDSILQEVWREVNASIIEVLNSVTVEDICRRKREREEVPMYHI